MMMMIVRMVTKTSTDNSNTAPTNGANSQPVSDLFPLFIIHLDCHCKLQSAKNHKNHIIVFIIYKHTH